MNKNTLILNLFGGPGTGKSTCGAYVFSKLKMLGVDCELITEFAKDVTWEGRTKALNHQIYITGKQSFKIGRCFGQVDVIITDSPILTGVAFTDPKRKYLKGLIVEEFIQYGENNLNIFLERVHDYNPNGRNQTEEEARSVDEKLLDAFEIGNYTEGLGDKIPYMRIPATETGYDKIVELVMNKINHNQ